MIDENKLPQLTAHPNMILTNKDRRRFQDYVQLGESKRFVLGKWSPNQKEISNLLNAKTTTTRKILLTLFFTPTS